MFFDEHKRVATVIRAKRDSKGNRTLDPTPMKPEHVQSSPGEEDGRHVAMQDFMAAHKEGSAQKMAMALANFMDLHSALHGEDGPGIPEVESGPDKES